MISVTLTMDLFLEFKEYVQDTRTKQDDACFVFIKYDLDNL